MFEPWWCVLKSAAIHLTLLSSCLIGDQVVNAGNILFGHSYQLRAVIDNFIHGSIGFLSWAVVTNGAEMKQCLLCGFIASVIDVDHFIAARSLQFKDALNLNSRPPFHNTFIIAVIPFTICKGLNLILQNSKLNIISYIYLTAIISHHVRDGYRRGIWLTPLPNVPKYPYFVYVIITILLPNLIKTFINPEMPLLPLSSVQTV